MRRTRSGITEAAGPGPSSCTRPDPDAGTTCDWLYFFDVCGESNTYGPTPGRPQLSSCNPTTTGPALRIEDERPGPGLFRGCQGFGTAASIVYEKLPQTGGLQVQYSTTSGTSRSLTVDLECDPSAPPQFADEGEHNYVPDRLAEVFNSGAATLTWRTSGFCAGGGRAPLIIGGILGALAFYLLGGVAYGRHKNPPSQGDGAFAHPEGKGMIAWHPHHEKTWGEGMALVSDGFRFTLARVRGESYDPGRGLKSDDALMLAADEGEESDAGRRSRRKRRESDAKSKSKRGKDGKKEKRERSSSSRSKRGRSSSKSSKTPAEEEPESGGEKKWKAQVDMSWMPPKPELAKGARETGVKVDFGSSGEQVAP